MQERTTRKSVTFLHPFSLAGVDGKLESGTGRRPSKRLLKVCRSLPFVEFRRRSRSLPKDTAAARQVVTIVPAISNSARARRGIEVSTGPLAHLVAR